MKAAYYDAPGGPEVLSYTDVEAPVCPEDGVLLRVEAISVEGGDLINRATAAPQAAGHVPGYAASGEIVEVGAKVNDCFIGQKVTSFDMGGSHAELRAVKATRTWIVPEGLQMAAAAALPISFGTAHHSLFARGNLVEGETLLVQGGAGSVGVAAIQLAHRAGAKVLATVSGADRVARLQAYGLDAAIDHRSEDVTAAVMRLTDGHGVNLVVDPVGSTLAGSLAALRPEGRLVFVGNAGRASLGLDLWPALQANQTLLGVFMGSQLEKPDVHRTVDDMLRLAATGELEVPIDRRFSLCEAAAAHAYAEENAILGRVVLVP
ncbi:MULTISPECIES: zinc-binding alcohol dehydrogenase family protein [unclassified Modicisalibacter]|uniref:quinone oxidoreductase family protein n=1 Tax=unclassified Modicisalibacter TaxID=2679913 RepID=UPI001CCA5DAC|nr:MULTISPECIES: zinc-binding alcohol dehydrogenase family protein [unclassified Modicisalibacter]MBZ9559695.1 zinc-binding alcohol dehydrogenase family protein [Modicisalibacter sp. R2A 31.J]MBZ9577147.1 zinc-binding alcohol dehydrogenase family protein [Modicisalibacter sp. MOD 31.J]